MFDDTPKCRMRMKETSTARGNVRQMSNALRLVFSHLKQDEANAALEQAGLSPEARPEDLGMDDYVRLADVISALLGAWSHVLLDALMHADVQLLSPLSASNGIRGLIDLGHLHLLCVLLGVAGAARLVVAVASAESETL